MRFHRNLALTLFIGNVLSFLVQLFAMSKASYNGAGIVVALGWLFCLGLFNILSPLVVKREWAKDWFTKKYVWGTIILCVLHILLLIITGCYAAVLLHKW